jgi:purine-binding chemotaxis protein CheW
VNLFSQLVVFFLDDQRYALELDAVERTVRMVEITPLPRAPEIVLGVITFQGRIVPVLDLRLRFRLPPREPGLTDQLIIARTRRRTVALFVDGVSGVVETAPEEIVGPAEIVPGLEYVTGVTRQGDGLVFIHDLDRFLSLDEEQALDAAMTP